MLQQRIPSVIAKIFRSFIDLSPAYYTNTIDNKNTSISYNKDDPALSDSADLNKAEEEDDDSMISLDDAGSIIAGILEQLVRNGSVLKRLVIDDTFYTIIRLVLTKPAEWDDSQLDQTKEPTYMIWKKK